ncbi:MAG: hypothetical protein R3F20_04000 [Planctomycetota bacterium]
MALGVDGDRAVAAQDEGRDAEGALPAERETHRDVHPGVPGERGEVVEAGIADGEGVLRGAVQLVAGEGELGKEDERRALLRCGEGQPAVFGEVRAETRRGGRRIARGRDRSSCRHAIPPRRRLSKRVGRRRMTRWRPRTLRDPGGISSSR